MLFCTLCMLFTLFRDVASIDLSVANPDNFGPFTARWHHYKVCRGPKSRNDTLFQTELDIDGNSYGAVFNVTFYTTTRFDNIKISVYTIKSGIKQSLLWSYKLDNPCQHLVVGPMLESMFGAKNCVIKKGFYHEYMNFTTLAHDFFGNSFFYGEFLFKTIMLSKTGNIGCLNFYTIFMRDT